MSVPLDLWIDNSEQRVEEIRITYFKTLPQILDEHLSVCSETIDSQDCFISSEKESIRGSDHVEQWESYNRKTFGA